MRWARRVTQDPEGSFCPMILRTAGGFVTTDYQPPELPAKRDLLGRSPVRQLERKEEMKAYPPDDERFVKRRTSVKDWPVFTDYSRVIGGQAPIRSHFQRVTEKSAQ